MFNKRFHIVLLCSIWQKSWVKSGARALFCRITKINGMSSRTKTTARIKKRWTVDIPYDVYDCQTCALQCPYWGGVQENDAIVTDDSESNRGKKQPYFVYASIFGTKLLNEYIMTFDDIYRVVHFVCFFAFFDE